MITDNQANEILSVMKAGFEKIDQRLDRLEERMGKLEERVGRFEQTTSSLVEEVTSHGNILKNLVTKEEFSAFKDQTLNHFDALAGKVTDLQEAETLRTR